MVKALIGVWPSHLPHPHWGLKPLATLMPFPVGQSLVSISSIILVSHSLRCFTELASRCSWSWHRVQLSGELRSEPLQHTKIVAAVWNIVMLTGIWQRNKVYEMKRGRDRVGSQCLLPSAGVLKTREHRLKVRGGLKEIAGVNYSHKVQLVNGMSCQMRQWRQYQQHHFKLLDNRQ